MIAVARSGTGPPLVIVHGAVMGSIAWGMVASLLAPHCTVHALDRRGYGESGDTPPYAVEREIEDIVAVLGSIGEPAALLGHSSGAILALMVAERGQPLRRLMLYEPPLFIGGCRPRPVQDLPDRLEAFLAAGDRDAVLRTFLREGPAIPEPEIDRMQAGDGWDGGWAMLTAQAPALPHDARIATMYTLEPSRLRAIRTPTLLLLGSESPPWVQTDIGTLAATLPHSQIAILPGQEHLANVTAPDLLAREVVSFVQGAA
jgi:pimeloyl-ACP methyl ester carboxylesterase